MKDPCFGGGSLGNFMDQAARFLEKIEEIASPGSVQSFGRTTAALVAGFSSILTCKFTLNPSYFSHILRINLYVF